MSSDIKHLETLVVSEIGNGSTLTPDLIRSHIEHFSSKFRMDVTRQEMDSLARILETRYDVTMELGAVLQGSDYAPWLASSRAGIEPYYWPRYRNYLADNRKLGPGVVGALDAVTDRILNLTENPLKEGKWDRRGLVMGHVQSGKTANYIGLVCKAADAGYKAVIVIAGTQNHLRSQTQLRIDEGFVGRDSSRYLATREDIYVGVGRRGDRRVPVSVTNYARDFNRQMAESVLSLQSLKVPFVAVVKKNATTLANLYQWLAASSSTGLDRTIKESLLLIDDEADNASINVRYGSGETTRINMEIRRLLNLFDRSSYVGYTATPFANIFIDPDTNDDMLKDDLFPRSFIVSLDPPSDYFGADKIFLAQGADFLRIIDDNEDVLPVKQNSLLNVAALPESLESSVRAFVIARAVRLLRGHGSEHSTMMVNASAFINVQHQIAVLIKSLLEAIQNAARANFAMSEKDAMRNPEIALLREVWQEEFAHLGHAWSDVQKSLNEAAAPIEVRVVNTRSKDALNYRDYKEGLHLIVVGGSALSRGLTLEGLTISYLLRNTKMYDTLMQMGRWFGYRPDYGDLVRIWLDHSTLDAYRHIARSIEELRAEVHEMEVAGGTPADFGLKVRAHEGTLLITARNKLGASEETTVGVMLENELRETVVLDGNEGALKANRKAARELVDSLAVASFALGDATRDARGFLLTHVPAAHVLDFLRSFRSDKHSLRSDPVIIRQYILDRVERELALWDVLFVSADRDESTSLVDTTLGAAITCQQRTPEIYEDGTLRIVMRNSRVASRGVEKAGLTAEQVALAEARFREANQSGKKNISDRSYRLVRTRPLLMVHLLEILKDGKRRFEEPVVAWSISFPQTQLKHKPALFRVTRTYLREVAALPEETGDDDWGENDEE